MSSTKRFPFTRLRSVLTLCRLPLSSVPSDVGSAGSHQQSIPPLLCRRSLPQKLGDLPVRVRAGSAQQPRYYSPVNIKPNILVDSSGRTFIVLLEMKSTDEWNKEMQEESSVHRRTSPELRDRLLESGPLEIPKASLPANAANFTRESRIGDAMSKRSMVQIIEFFRLTGS